MARKDYTPEQAIGMLREAEVRLSQGEKIGKICRGLGISEQSYYRWRRQYGGLRAGWISTRELCAAWHEAYDLGGLESNGGSDVGAAAVQEVRSQGK